MTADDFDDIQLLLDWADGYFEQCRIAGEKPLLDKRRVKKAKEALTRLRVRHATENRNDH
jgi:hypothetical protein